MISPKSVCLTLLNKYIFLKNGIFLYSFIVLLLEFSYAWNNSQKHHINILSKSAP